jgi:hypothetical protein
MSASLFESLVGAALAMIIPEMIIVVVGTLFGLTPGERIKARVAQEFDPLFDKLANG